MAVTQRISADTAIIYEKDGRVDSYPVLFYGGRWTTVGAIAGLCNNPLHADANGKVHLPDGKRILELVPIRQERGAITRNQKMIDKENGKTKAKKKSK